MRSVVPHIDYDTRTRFVKGGELVLTMESGEQRTIEVEALGQSGFFLKTGGYGDWAGHKHGAYKGELHLDGEYIGDCYSDENLPRSASSATPRSACATATPSATASWRASSAACGPNSASPPNPITRCRTRDRDRHRRSSPNGFARSATTPT